MLVINSVFDSGHANLGGSTNARSCPVTPPFAAVTGEKTGFIYYELMTPNSWTIQKTLCETYGMTLAEVNNAEEYDDFYALTGDTGS